LKLGLIPYNTEMSVILTNREVDKRLGDRPIQRIGEVINSSTKLLWKCTVDGHEWMARPNDIFKGRGCPKCAGKLRITNELMDERLIGRNIQRIGDITNGSDKVLFKCLIDGHEWKAAPSHISFGSGCPKCGIRSRTATHRLSNEIIDERIKDRPIQRLGEFVETKQHVLWKCKVDGHEWLAMPNCILSGRGCPKCGGKLKMTNELMDERLIGRNIQRIGEVIDSETKILFKCLVDDHEWLATPSSISSGSGCPVCGIRMGANARRYNNEIIDERIMDRHIQRLGEFIDTQTHIRWKCLIDGHEWETAPSCILSGSGCPKCAGRLKMTNELMDERLIGRGIRRLGEVIDSDTKVLFKCLIDGHEWLATPGQISYGSGCPKCVGRIPLTNAIMDERLADRDIQRLGEVIDCDTKVLFRCLIDGHEWSATPNSVSRGSGCPVCAGNIPLTNDEIDKRIASLSIQRLDDITNSRAKMRWKCTIDGHIWMAAPHAVSCGRTGCPRCSASHGEKNIFKFLDDHKIEYVHQMKFPDCKNIRPLPFDFYIKQHKILIEYQGGQHFMVKFYGDASTAYRDFERRQINDGIKKSWAEANGYTLLYFTYEQTDQEIIDELTSVLIDPKK
jgi:very-short-patch-repair endonuclease